MITLYSCLLLFDWDELELSLNYNDDSYINKYSVVRNYLEMRSAYI